MAGRKQHVLFVRFLRVQQHPLQPGPPALSGQLQFCDFPLQVGGKRQPRHPLFQRVAVADDGPIALILQMSVHEFRKHHRTVFATGATEADSQLTFPLRHVQGN